MPDSATDTAPNAAKTDKEILDEGRQRLQRCVDDEKGEREKKKGEMIFSTLDQWPEDVRKARENDPNGSRPCLTIDQINQYIVQVVNDLRQNRPAAKARPVDDRGDVKTAEVIQGVIRHIEADSVAQIPYMTGAESAVRIGEGYFRYVTEYESETSFNQVILAKRIPDALAVYLGPHVLPTGADAEYGFVIVDTPQTVFRRNWPLKKWQSVDFNELQGSSANWYVGSEGEPRIKVAEYFYFDYSEPTKILFLSDGSIVKEKEWKKDQRTVQDERETRIRSTKWCKLTGVEILQKRDWAGKYIPIVKVTGKEAWVDGKRTTWGLVRPAMDSLRMYNYWASTITEKLALSPKAPYIGAVGQFATSGDRWDKANVVNFSRLEYDPIDINGTPAPPPQRQAPAQIEVAMVQQLQQIREDVQASLGMFKASLGKEQPNQSGKAILALTHASDTGTFHFADNLALSIQHGCRILIDLIPKIYDTQRVMKILGEDGKVTTAEIDPEQQEAVREVTDAAGAVRSIYNLGVGEYDVTATVGPSYATQRMEAATMFTDLANSDKNPMSAAILRYQAIKNADFNGAEKAAEMLEVTLPPGALKKDGQPPIPPEVVQKMKQMEEAGNELVQENQELKSGVQQDMAKIESQHMAKMKEIEQSGMARAAELQQERAAAEEKARLDRWVAEQDVALATWKAEREIEIKERLASAQAAAVKTKAESQPASVN